MLIWSTPILTAWRYGFWKTCIHIYVYIHIYMYMFFRGVVRKLKVLNFRKIEPCWLCITSYTYHHHFVWYYKLIIHRFESCTNGWVWKVLFLISALVIAHFKQSMCISSRWIWCKIHIISSSFHVFNDERFSFCKSFLSISLSFWNSIVLCWWYDSIYTTWCHFRVDCLQTKYRRCWSVSKMEILMMSMEIPDSLPRVDNFSFPSSKISVTWAVNLPLVSGRMIWLEFVPY